jgi:hypothetical protein
VKAGLPIFMSGILATLAGNASAGPWSIEPRLGASAEYDSNPGLREPDPLSEDHVAALFDLPLRYDADDIAFSLRPSGRVSNSRGYSSLAANYFHVDTSAQVTDERGSASIQAELARDSSLYHAGGFVNGLGVRRDSAATSADWIRSMTERSQIQLDVSWTRVRYDQPPDATALVDYRYLSAGPTLAFALSERSTLKVLGSYGRYQSLDGITESTTENLQLGFERQFDELWSLSTSAGYSRSANSQKYFFGPFFLGTLSSDQNSGVYAATLTRQAERYSLSGGVSRALQPTGFAYLSRQDSITLSATYVRTERWDFGLSAGWQRARNPTLGGRETSVRYLSSQLTTNWHWTPQWIISMRLTRFTQEYGPPTVSAASSGISVEINRQFLRSEL